MSFILHMQWRLLLRNWAFWAVCALGLLLTWDASDGPPGSLLFFIGESGFRMVLVGQMVVTAAMAQRERAERVQELVEALPYRPAAWVGGRFLASFLVWLGYSVLLWLVAGLTQVLGGYQVDWAGLGLHWLVTAPVALAWSTAMGLALGQMLGSAVTVYVLLPIIWVVQTLLPMFVEGSMGYRAPGWMDFVPNDRFFPGTSAGYMAIGLHVAVNRLWHLSVAGLLCAGLTWAIQRRRAMRAMTAGLLALLCLVGTVGAPFAWEWADGLRESAYAAEGAGLPQGVLPPAKSAPLRTDRYDLAVSLDPAQHRLSATGSFDVTNQGADALSELTLTLRSSLTVTSGSADFRREGDYVVMAVPLAPGETKRLTLSWEGAVWQWRRIGEGGPPLRLAAHISPDSIFLPATYAWYPLPNQQQLAFRSAHKPHGHVVYEVNDLPAHHLPVSFALTVTGTDLPLLHNAGSGVTGLYLISAPAPEPAAPGVEFAGDSTNLAEAKQLAEIIAERIAFYQTLVPKSEVGPVRLIEVSTATNLGNAAFQNPDLAPGAILLWPSEYMSLLGQPTYLDRATTMVTGLWWPAERGLQYHAVYDGLARYMEWARTGKDPGFGWEGADQVAQALISLDHDRGRDATVAVLREMYALAQSDQLTQKAFEAALSKAGGKL